MSAAFLNVPRTRGRNIAFSQASVPEKFESPRFFWGRRHAYYHIRCVLNERPALHEIRLIIVRLHGGTPSQVACARRYNRK